MKFAFAYSILTLALLVGFAQAEVADFDSIDDGADFNGSVDDITVSGNFSLTGTGVIQENGSVAFLFQGGGMATEISGTFQVLTNPGDAPQIITLNEVVISLDADTTLTGLSEGGVVEWEISGDTMGVQQSFTAPTTGAFANEITSIVWNQPNYVQGTFPTNLDLVDFDVVGPAPVADVFDLNSVDDMAGFNGAIDDISASGDFSLTGAGFIQENDTTAFLFEGAGGTNTQLTGTMQILSNPGDTPENVTIQSIGANMDANTTITGLSAGGTVQQWQISGATAGVQTFTAATTGSFGNAIDTIVWDQPNYVAGTFPTNIDFINFFLAAPMTTLKGDVDLSSTVDFADIPAFIGVLQGGGSQPEADCDCSGGVDFADIPAFIAILQGG